MPKKFYSHELNRVLEVPDDFTVEQVMAWEDELRGDRGILNKAAGFTRGLLPGAIQGAAGMVEGVGGMTSSDTIKGIAGLMRDNPVSKYLIERPIQDEGNVGRTAGELAGNIATMFTPGAAARVAGAAPRVARGLSTLAGVAQSAGEATGEVRRNREQGMDVTPGEEMSAAWKAAPLGLLDAAVPTRLLSRIDDFGGRDLAKKGLASLLGRSAVTGGIEGATETAQQLGLNLVERGYNPNQAINEGLLESAQAGGAAGMAIDMGLSILGRRIARKGARNIERAMGESPQIPDDGIAGIGIRRDAQGEADVRAMRGRVEPPPILPDATIPAEVTQLLPGFNETFGVNENLPIENEPPTIQNQPKVQAMAKVARGYSVPVTYAVVPIGSLRISNDDVGQINPNYPQELQPRQRDRKSSDEQINGIMANLDPEQLGENYFASDGAPIIGKDYAVESGNGRSMALRRAYATRPETAEVYKNWLTTNAARFGISPEQVASTKNPVLVRVRQGLPEGVSRTDFARDANEDTKAQMSAGEQALIDARTMSNDIVSMFKPNESGDIVTRDNAQFITRFFDEVIPQGQRGAMRLPDGTISKAGIDRIRNAVFARAYNDRGIVERLAEDPDDNIKNVVGALTTAAPRMIWMRGGIDSGDFFDLNPAAEITAAASRLAHLRENRMPVQDYLNQMTFEPRDPMEDAILSVFGTYGRSKTDIAEVLNDYVSAVQAVGNPKQEGMFGPTEPPSKLALLRAIIEAKQQRDAEAKQQRAEKQAGGLDAAGVARRPRSSAGGGPQNAGSQNYSIATEALDYPAYTVRSLTRQVEAGTKPQIALDLFSELKRLRMDDLVSTKIVDAMSTKDGNKAHGSYANKIITLSLESADKAKLIQTLNHEAVHAMKKIGMFTDTEWNVLQAALDPSVMMSDEERRVYGEYFKGDTTRMREEAIARGIEGYVAGTLKLPKPATGIIAKAVNALDAIGLATRKQTAADVIKAQQSGEIGGRYVPEVTAEPTTPSAPTPTTGTDLVDELPDDDTEASFSIFSPQDQSQYDRLFGKQDKRGFLQKLKETYEDYRKPQKQTIDSFGMRTRQQGLDKRAGIERLSEQSDNKAADVSAIAATRFADNAGNVAVAALTKGRLELVGTAGNGYFQASDKNDGLFRKDGQLAKLQKEGKLEATFWAAGAERAAELMGEGKEKLYTPADIARGRQFLKDPEIAAGVAELKGHFDSLIDALQASGMITPQSASKMKAKAYFPFYRIMEDKNGNIVAAGPRGFQETLVQAPPGGGLGLGNLAALHKLKGGENPINDPVENIARNTFALTSLAMRNVAAQRVMRDGKALGYVKQVASDKSAPDTVKVWINGKPRYFAVLDKVLYDSVQASGIEVGSLMKVIGVGPAKFLRNMVTSDPVFMVRNALRDSTQLWMQGYSAAPFTNIAGGLRKALTNAESYDTLQRMGVIGTGVRGEGIDETASNLRGELGDKGLAARAMDRKNKVLAGSEAIGRITVYDSVRKRGGSPAQAAYEALELLNFGRKGSSPFVQWVAALTPFLNAHAQGTDVIYRTMRGKGVGGAKQQRQLFQRGAALFALTALYAIMSQGEEYYENATGEEKDLYWFVPIPGSKEAFKIPTPFELAIPFKILPEHMVNLTLGKEIPDDAWKAAKRAVSSVFGIQPPQTIKPILEGTTNYDLFRQRAIEPESMKRLEPAMRYDDYTAELSKSLGQATNLSPLQIDHLIKGYTGSMGTLALNIMDAVLEYGTSPEARFNQPSTIPAVGRMFQREDGGKMLVDFYELRDIAEQAVATQRAMAKQGMVDSPAGQQKRAQRVAVAKATEKMDNQIAVQRRLRKKIMSLPESEITPAQKRDALNEIRRREIEITRPAQNLRRAVQ